MTIRTFNINWLVVKIIYLSWLTCYPYVSPILLSRYRYSKGISETNCRLLYARQRLKYRSCIKYAEIQCTSVQRNNLMRITPIGMHASHNDLIHSLVEFVIDDRTDNTISCLFFSFSFHLWTKLSFVFLLYSMSREFQHCITKNLIHSTFRCSRIIKTDSSYYNICNNCYTIFISLPV